MVILKKNITNIFFTLLNLVIFFTVVFFISLIMSVVATVVTRNITDTRVSFAISKTIDTMAILFGVFLFFKIKKEFNIIKKLKEQLFLKNNVILKFNIIGCICALIIPILLFIIGYMQFSWLIWNKLFLEDIIPIIILGLVECLFESFCEEIMYRLVVYEITMKRLNKAWVYFLSTIIYVLIYLFDSNITVISLVNIALLNIVMMNIYIKYKNIWLCIIPRTIFEYIVSYGFSMYRYGNQTAGIVGFSICGNNLVNGGTYGVYGSIITTITLLALVSITSYKFFIQKKLCLKVVN